MESNSGLPFCLNTAFPYIKYTCRIYISKLGPLREPLVVLVAADPYAQVMNDLAVSECKLDYTFSRSSLLQRALERGYRERDGQSVKRRKEGWHRKSGARKGGAHCPSFSPLIATWILSNDWLLWQLKSGAKTQQLALAQRLAHSSSQLP